MAILGTPCAKLRVGVRKTRHRASATRVRCSCTHTRSQTQFAACRWRQPTAGSMCSRRTTLVLPLVCTHSVGVGAGRKAVGGRHSCAPLHALRRGHGRESQHIVPRRARTRRAGQRCLIPPAAWTPPRGELNQPTASRRSINCVRNTLIGFLRVCTDTFTMAYAAGEITTTRWKFSAPQSATTRTEI